LIPKILKNEWIEDEEIKIALYCRAVYKDDYKQWVKSAYAISKEKEIEEEKKAGLFGGLFGNKKIEVKEDMV